MTHLKLRGIPRPCFVILVVLALSVVGTAHASVVVAQNIRQLAERSEFIVLADVERTVSRWGAGRIVTEARGGRVGAIAMRVIGAAEFHEGQRSILFLARAGGALRVTGMARGKLDLDAVEQAWRRWSHSRS